jgi:hypothetical protein
MDTCRFVVTSITPRYHLVDCLGISEDILPLSSVSDTFSGNASDDRLVSIILLNIKVFVLTLMGSVLYFCFA